VVTAAQILEQVWGESDDPKPELVRTAVARLRARLVDAFGQPFLVTAARPRLSARRQHDRIFIRLTRRC
jgi:DNA-binding response OmpR family regulator